MLTFHHPRYSAKQVGELLGISIHRAAKLPLDWTIEADRVRRCTACSLLAHIKQTTKV